MIGPIKEYDHGGHVAAFSPPEIAPVMRGQMWRLEEDWAVEIDDHAFIVPLGEVFDGASIPRFLWRVCGHPMQQPRLPIAIFHDAAYSARFPSLTRAEADRLYRDGVIAVGVPKWKAYVEWAALRLCGATHWESVGDWEGD